uniref:Uncharacterized protein n=1 Tax=Ciona savignyi TaxID=51511 RepID=H2Z550_CIOSA
MVSATLGFLFGAFLFAFPDFYLSYTVDSSLDVVHLFYTRVFGALTGGISLACACAVYFNEDTQNSVIITTLVTHSCYLWIAIYHHMNDDDYHTIGHTIDIALHAILVIDLLLGVFATDSVKKK